MVALGLDLLSGKVSAFNEGSLNTTVTGAAPPGVGDVYSVGQVFVDEAADTAYVLVDVTAGVATWQAIGSGGTVPDATELVKGKIRIATQVETDTGTDDTITVTPLKLATNLATKSLLSWNAISLDQAITMGEGYVATPTGTLTLTLPATASVGEMFRVIAIGSGGVVRISQNAGQSIRLLSQVTTTGVGGYVLTTGEGDSFTIICTTANTGFYILDAVGNLNLL